MSPNLKIGIWIWRLMPHGLWYHVDETSAIGDNIMKTNRVTILVAMVLALLICCPVQTNGITSIHVRGNYRHQGFGMIFPESIGALKRVQITEFSPDGKDVGVGYNLISLISPIAITVYVYPAPSLMPASSPPDVAEMDRARLFQNHLNELKREILAASPSAKITADDDFSIMMGGQSYKGRKVTFQLFYNFDGRLQDSISQLYLFQNGTWLIKYRATYPKQTAITSEAAVVDFINKLVWPANSNP